MVLPGMRLESDSQNGDSTEELKGAVLEDGTYSSSGSARYEA